MIIDGVCLFGSGSAYGMTVVGTGCFSNMEKLAAFDVRTLNHGPDNQTWLFIPGFVGSERVLLLSQLSSCRDFRLRPSFWGFGIGIKESSVTPGNIISSLVRIEELALEVRRLIGSGDQQVSFERAKEFVNGIELECRNPGVFRVGQSRLPERVIVDASWLELKSFHDAAQLAVFGPPFRHLRKVPIIISDADHEGCILVTSEDSIYLDKLAKQEVETELLGEPVVTEIPSQNKSKNPVALDDYDDVNLPTDLAIPQSPHTPVEEPESELAIARERIARQERLISVLVAKNADLEKSCTTLRQQVESRGLRHTATPRARALRRTEQRGQVEEVPNPRGTPSLARVPMTAARDRDNGSVLSSGKAWAMAGLVFLVSSLALLLVVVSMSTHDRFSSLEGTSPSHAKAINRSRLPGSSGIPRLPGSSGIPSRPAVSDHQKRIVSLTAEILQELAPSRYVPPAQQNISRQTHKRMQELYKILQSLDMDRICTKPLTKQVKDDLLAQLEMADTGRLENLIGSLHTLSRDCRGPY